MSATAKVYRAWTAARRARPTLPDELFGQPVNEHLLWLSVKRHLGNQRQGTAKVKSRGRGLGRRQEAVHARRAPAARARARTPRR